MPTYEYVDPKTGQVITKQATDATSALQGTGQSGVRLVTQPAVNNTQNVAKPYVAPQPPDLTPQWAKDLKNKTSASPSEAYGLNDVEMARYNESKAGATAPQLSEEEVFNNTLRRYQGEIDATNNIFASKLREANTAGLNRSGSQNAQQARAGLLGSDFGNAQDEKINQYNTQVTNDIRDEQSLAIASILGKARSGAKEELAAKRLARDTDYTKYKELLTTSSERKATKTNAYAKELLAKGTTLEKLLELDPTEFSGTGLSKQEVINAFKDAQTEQAKIAKAGQFDLSEGQARYDANGNIIAQRAKTYAPETGSSSKIVKINGVDYVQNADGSYTKPVLPVSTTISDTSKQALKLVDSLLPVADKITGAGQNPLNITGFSNAKALNEYNQLKSLLTLENRTLLKGSGAISDFEAKTLEKAATSLGRNLSNEDFKTVLTNLKAELQAGDPNTGVTGGLLPQEQSTVDQMRKDGIPDDVIEQVIGKPLSLGNVGGDTNQALRIANAIKQVESRGNYNAVGDAGTSKGAYQFQPASWSGWSQKYLGQSNLPMTPENQDKVAMARINDLLNQGYNAEQIALIWNGGEPVRKKGFNAKIGLAYDSGAYADKVLKQLS